MFCYQPDYKKPTEPVSKALFDQLVDSEQTRWLTARHRELRAALPAIMEGDTTLLGQWQDFEPFLKYCRKEERSTEKKGTATKGEWFNSLTTEQKLQEYCKFLKESLPFVIFIATYEESVSEKKKLRRRWRKQAACQLNGLCVIDFDHVEGDCREVWENAFARLSNDDKARIVLVFVTPSGQGLKVVFTADADLGNLFDNQMVFACKLGLGLDGSCKDASRGTFLTSRDDILLIDEGRLFDYHDPAFGAKWDEAYHKGKSQPTLTAEEVERMVRNEAHYQDCVKSAGDCGSAPQGLIAGKDPRSPERNNGTDSPLSSGRGDGGEGLFRDPNLTYHDVPYFKIVDAWLNGAVIKPGDRHRTSLRLADHLRYITDNDPVLMETILRQTPFVDEIVKERNEDVAGTVESAREYKMYKNIPQQMQEALERVKIEQNDTTAPQGLIAGKDPRSPQHSGDTTALRQAQGPSRTDVYAQLPFQQWANDLTELAEHYPCMKELFANVHPYKLPAVWFSAAAMFGTLMTRTWYRFWYEPQTVRRLNYSIFIIGDPGSGKNVIEKFYFKICDPMLKSDQVSIDAVNRYKEGRTERSTSTKAQKGEALKKPVVGIRVHPARTSTGEFIRHMMAAVEQVQGQNLNLHMFSFDAELDNVTKQNKGGDYKDREILEIKAFHNETDGQFYANSESVTAMFKVYWNFVYTGTPYALSRKVNQRNFGTGLCTRLAVIPLPDEGMAERHQEQQNIDDEALKAWAYKLDKVEGELPIEPLNDETYDWQSARLEIAQFNQDKADRTLLKRIPYYGIGISLPFILMRHWDEWQESKTLSIDDTDKRLCRLAMEIQYRCQHFFFGEMAHSYFEDQGKEFAQRRRTSRYDECFRKLPDEFKTEQFMECFGCSQQAASRAILRFKNDGLVENVKYGVYKKTAASLP